jgi:hypothetical protein
MPTVMSNLDIPADFPVGPVIAAVSGVQPQMSMIEEGGKFYVHGTSPSEVAAAYAFCEDLAAQLTAYCESKVAEGVGTKDQILERAHASLVNQNWCTPPQAIWTLRRTARLLHWELPTDFPTR